MENKGPDTKASLLKVLRGLILIVLIFSCGFFVLFGISVHQMQSDLIIEIMRYIDTGEFSKIGNIDRKGIAINHHLIFYSFMISLCSLMGIILWLVMSLRKTKRKLAQKNDTAPTDDMKDPTAKG
jgi:hypothetical protein